MVTIHSERLTVNYFEERGTTMSVIVSYSLAHSFIWELKYKTYDINTGSRAPNEPSFSYKNHH